MSEPMAVLDPAEYPIRDLDSLPSPLLLVFREKVEANIARMRSYLEGVAGGRGSGFRHLRCHAKTSKSSWAVRLQLAAGIAKFKATPNELSLLLGAGARDIFVAYPPLPHLAERIAAAIAAGCGAGRKPPRVLSQIGAPEHARSLAQASRRQDVQIEYLIDLDVGMGRTGIAPGRAPDLLEAVRRIQDEEKGCLRFAGLHAYDGHNTGATPEARALLSDQAMAKVIGCARELQHRRVPVPLVVAGGTPAFLPDLERLLSARIADEVEVSPGTWIFWDSAYERLLPGMFLPAALLFARVLDRPGEDRVVLDLGHKRWAIDSGPLQVFSREGLEVISASEEHTVLRSRLECEIRIGDGLFILPRHICPTVNLWESFVLVGPEGEVEIDSSPVDGRNR